MAILDVTHLSLDIDEQMLRIELSTGDEAHVHLGELVEEMRSETAVREIEARHDHEAAA